MAVTAKQYAKFYSQLSLKQAYASNTMKAALFTSSLTPSQTNDTLFSSAPYTSNQVASGTGYTTGGVALTSLTLTTAALITTFDAADIVITATGAGFTYRYIVFYDTTSGVVMCYADMGADVVVPAGTHTIQLDALGLARITVS